MRQRWSALAIALLGVGLVGLIAASRPLGSTTPTTDPAGSPILIGGSPLLDQPAPPFALQDLDDRPVSLADFAGRPVIVNFWASWCVPCRREFPVFVAGRAAHADVGLEVLGVVYKDDAEAARRFAQENGATWPMLLDPGERTHAAYLGIFVPYTVFVDGAGIVRGVSFGEVSEAGFGDQVGRILPEV